MPLEPRLDLVVGEEGDVAGVRHRQDLPVLQQARPGLQKEKDGGEMWSEKM